MFLDKPELGPTGFDQIFNYWGKSFEWAARGKPQPVAEAAWEWLNANMPTSRPTALSWGDCRIANVLFAPDGSVRAVVDWEMLSLGGHEMDLGWWLFLDDFHAFETTRLPGLGTRADTVERWEAGTGEKANDLHWYDVFAGFRFAIVMMRLAQMFESWGMDIGGGSQVGHGDQQRRHPRAGAQARRRPARTDPASHVSRLPGSITPRPP